MRPCLYKQFVRTWIAFNFAFLLMLVGVRGETAAVSDDALFHIPHGNLLWQIGIPDDLSSEFGDFRPGAEVVNIPSVGAKLDAAACAKISCGVRASINPTFDINFPLEKVPLKGVLFTLKLLDAPKSGSQMAVFSNGAFAGLIQLWGTAGTNYPYPWRKTYRLYIPKELLQGGRNELRCTAPHSIWGDDSNDDQQWWKWDYLKLEALDAPVGESWHGKISYLGTTMTLSDEDFKVNQDTLRLAPVVLKWLGIAYSGNTMRANFWRDVVDQQPRRLDYLRLLASYNMTVLADFISGNHFKNDPAGEMPQEMKDALKTFLREEGPYIQYYELGNEPCMFGGPASGGFAEYVALARELKADKPGSMKIVAPGWAYGGGKGGSPPDWDAFVDNRREVEKACDCINGHSYGYSYADNRGGSFLEELRDFSEVEDGWPKEYLTSETGSNNGHSEENGAHQASSQPHIQAFDRILRAHLAVVDRTMQHAAIFADYGLFTRPGSFADLNRLAVMPAPDGAGKDSRVKTYRRLALAYATHGSPLPYVVLNEGDLRYKMVYFRGVDSGTLLPQAASGATANKILLNFVNFEDSSQTLSVRVTLPRSATYAAERIGAGDTWGTAHSVLTLAGTPDLELKENLGPGESVQYILSRP
jgi:hypothetical protein